MLHELSCFVVRVIVSGLFLFCYLKLWILSEDLLQLMIRKGQNFFSFNKLHSVML